MSTPVIASSWAGSFDCDFCNRKRLMGDEFSKRQLENHRKNGTKLKCKHCVQRLEQAERETAAKNAVASDETRECSMCHKDLSMAQYNKTQWKKNDKAKCRACVEASVQQEQEQQRNAKQAKMQAARQKVADAKRSGNAMAILKAESELSAMEAEKVTGLKPVRMGRGRGRGRGGGRGRGSGRRRGRGRR